MMILGERLCVERQSATSIAADITLSDDLLFIACNAAGLLDVDVANPRFPRFVGNLPTLSPAESVTVVDDRVYVATKDKSSFLTCR